MENNLNNSGIEDYCNRFCAKLANRHFASNDKITGKEILELQEIRQINLFVIKSLLSEWTKETARIKSPYFNYENPDVKNAMKEFMNVLSRHISIEKDDFLPLLNKATHDTLLLIFSPYDYYMRLIHDPSKQELSLTELKRMSKYVKINNNLLQELIKKLEDLGDQTVSEQEVRKLLNDVFESIQESPEDVGDYIDMFSDIEPLNETIIYGESAKAESEEPETSEEEDNYKAHEVGQQYTWDTDETLKTINDKHSSEQKPTLSDIHRNRKIDNIRKHISINQRFMFINILFQGDEASFNRTIDYLDNCENKELAMTFISNEHAEWKLESEEVEEFMELIDKRLP